MKRTGGTWDRTDQPCYFMAGATPKQLRGEMPPSGHYLVPMDDIKSDRDIDQLADYCTRAKILIDSGVFFLASRHARKHGIELAEAFRLAADQMDGFDTLFDTYLRTLRRVGPLCWGYIEFDLGDAARKTQMRTDLERQGFAPIPVFHLSRDGWDYFDELASQYDRVCVGNLVDLKGRFADKTRIVHELHLRRKRHPHVWLHLLGMSPTEHFHHLQVTFQVVFEPGFPIEHTRILPHRHAVQNGDWLHTDKRAVSRIQNRSIHHMAIRIRSIENNQTNSVFCTCLHDKLQRTDIGIKPGSDILNVKKDNFTPFQIARRRLFIVSVKRHDTNTCQAI